MSEAGERFVFTERDLLIQLRQDVKNLTEETRRTHGDSVTDLRDHEARLRILENFRWWILGAGFVAGAFGSFIGRIVWH